MNESSRSDSLSGLTATEAQEFHKIFMMSFIIFTVIAIIAHFLVWAWRPWIPGPNGYAMLQDSVAGLSAFATPFIG